MKKSIFIVKAIVFLCLAGCEKAEMPKQGLEAEQKETEIVDEDWRQVEETYTTTHEILGANMALTSAYQYLYFITSEEDLRYIKNNYRMIINNLDEYPLSEYCYVICCKRFSGSEHFHHADYLEYNKSINEIRFHYDIWKAPSPDKVTMSQTWRVYMDFAAVPKAFFEEKKIERLLSPQEMWEKEEKLRKNAIIIE